MTLSDSTSSSAQRTAAWALALATVFWGCGFTWAKMGGDAVNLGAGLDNSAAFGPIFLLGWRFGIGGIVWLALFPAARRGWTGAGIARSVVVGLSLALGLIVQHVGLGLTSEAVSAFLTSLTILFVPLLLTFAMGKPPRAVLWLGVALAMVGVWLMTGAAPTGFGKGELLGLLCALGFSVYILIVNAVSKHETPWRITAGQFLTVSFACFVTCAMVPHTGSKLSPAIVAHVLSQSRVWANLILLSIFPTLAAFGLLTHFQPRIDPTRAALIYLIEPIIAAAYAAIAVHHYPASKAALGALLILLANGLVEILSTRAAKTKAPMVVD